MKIFGKFGWHLGTKCKVCGTDLQVDEFDILCEDVALAIFGEDERWRPYFECPVCHSKNTLSESLVPRPVLMIALEKSKRIIAARASLDKVAKSA